MKRSVENDSSSTVINANHLRLSGLGLLFFGVSFQLLFMGCAGDERPKEVFGQKKMVEIMVDIHLAEGAEKTDLLTTDSVRISESALYQHVFDKHKITEDQYNRSFEWYSEHLKEFDEVYVKVIEKLNQMEATRQQLRNR